MNTSAISYPPFSTDSDCFYSVRPILTLSLLPQIHHLLTLQAKCVAFGFLLSAHSFSHHPYPIYPISHLLFLMFPSLFPQFRLLLISHPHSLKQGSIVSHLHTLLLHPLHLPSLSIYPDHICASPHSFAPSRQLGSGCAIVYYTVSSLPVVNVEPSPIHFNVPITFAFQRSTIPYYFFGCLSTLFHL